MVFTQVLIDARGKAGAGIQLFMRPLLKFSQLPKIRLTQGIQTLKGRFGIQQLNRPPMLIFKIRPRRFKSMILSLSAAAKFSFVIRLGQVLQPWLIL